MKALSESLPERQVAYECENLNLEFILAMKKKKISICSLWEKNFPPSFNVKTKLAQLLLPEKKSLNLLLSEFFCVSFLFISTVRVTAYEQLGSCPGLQFNDSYSLSS